MRKIIKTTLICILASVIVLTVTAQEKTGSDAADVAKKLANPIASLTSVPFQNNMDVGIGVNNGWRNTLNFQPVIPIKLSDKLNLIGRWVQPIVFQQNVMDEKNYQGG